MTELPKGPCVHFLTQPYGTRGSRTSTVQVQLEVMNSCFIRPNDAMSGNGDLSLARGQRKQIGRVSLLPCLSERGAGMEVGRTEPDGQRWVVVKLPFFYNARFRAT